ncbi:nuclear transport factor 2 family protein [Mucilaginibacter phyllosphaerae]|uniref:HD-GYP domain-containing protein (C-di-GMP phosphodiesterase class II) n=1 Tax=Mucilaginibacter phyllosphaerae TaxID=1812349 RepID=A0A4Y8A829_9SPHI|nr:nuclear transport factor 2 family protein [Mucilaginibacter phyllosphaerae]MBB3971152.1 HD-GYP domain-containing protein (c-di-GMP phosphodiesterase class II) [Mucilaginibacter phyllosphaerae]TEW63877.1 nuclear transport factor 2 family protein [Mucilaginibacter phyllosphaerae]GGH22773.1 hypothetical protein GCM10007352_36300 [Mucilaginibacter phyllosphaerae]
MQKQQNIIKSYINAYNNFGIDGMLATLDESIVFENITDGKLTMTLKGINEFKIQAEYGKALFSSRRQTITDFKDASQHTEIEINYHAVLATDLPNGMKKGHELNLKGRSIFKFTENKIVYIRDES